MNSTMRESVAVMACVLVASTFVMPPRPAESQTLMDLFRGGPRRVEQSPLIRTEPAPGFEEQRRREAARRSEPQPVVAGPTYYSYKAEPLERLDFAELADPLTTGSVSILDVTASDRAFKSAAHYLDDIRIDALPEIGDAVEAFYAERPEYIWTADSRVNDRAREVLAAFDDAGSFGLSPADYDVGRPQRSDDADWWARELIRFEMEMSVKALTYVLDATRGRIDPNKISGYHDFERRTVDLDAAMRILANTIDMTSYLEHRSPNHEKFGALRDELERLRVAEEADRITIAEGTFLRPGSESEELSNVIAAIRLEGSDTLKTDHALTFADYDGGARYEGALVDLVKAFQSESGLMVDGIVGRNTVRAMTGLSNADKVEKVKLAMERLRWLNRDLGDRHIMINAPAFAASYTEDGEEALSMRTVVGTKQNQTYFFQDELEHVEFNPYWGVPRSIIVNEMLPKLRRDPSYLDRLGYELTTQSGTQIASSSVDWYGVGAHPPYNVRQPPGPSNALGELKIMFPNPHAIYMHDTPAQELFSRDSRAYSHGCVRLQDPRAMAAAVLGTTKAEVAGHIADGRNKAVEIEAEIPVYVAYFTAWPNAEGEVEYFADIYDRDMYLKRAIAANDAVRHAES